MNQQDSLGDREPQGADIREEPVFQRRAWKVERIAWAIMALVVLLAMAGVFGRGPASWREATSPDGQIRVEYERFVRRQAPTEFRIWAHPARGSADGRVRLWINSEYLSSVRLEQVQPPPEVVQSTGQRTVLVFRADDMDNAREQGLRVVLHVQVQALASLRGRIGLVTGATTEPEPSVSFKQWAYP